MTTVTCAQSAPHNSGFSQKQRKHLAEYNLAELLLSSRQVIKDMKEVCRCIDRQQKIKETPKRAITCSPGGSFSVCRYFAVCHR